MFLVGEGVLGKMAGDLPRIRGLDLGLRERDLFLDLDFLSRDLERRGLLDRLGLLVRERVRERLYLLSSRHCGWCCVKYCMKSLQCDWPEF